MNVAPAAAAVAVAVTKTVAVRAAVLTVLVIAAPAAKSVGVSFTRNRLSLVSAHGISLGDPSVLDRPGPSRMIRTEESEIHP